MTAMLITCVACEESYEEMYGCRRCNGPVCAECMVIDADDWEWCPTCAAVEDDVGAA